MGLSVFFPQMKKTGALGLNLSGSLKGYTPSQTEAAEADGVSTGETPWNFENFEVSSI
jgi:hypothetical protein